MRFEAALLVVWWRSPCFIVRQDINEKVFLPIGTPIPIFLVGNKVATTTTDMKLFECPELVTVTLSDRP